ncbi:MAG: response regulator [Verrucomicrobiaceae bacterium]|nr:response regulator [Verrucomicrobiaceae bacterium]
MSGKAQAHKVLVIEDDPALMFGLRENLEMEGYMVLTAVDGELGLELARRERPDLIVLDIMLPGLNGFQICRELREDEFDMPIMMLTALGQEDDVVKGLNLGADDYLTKPFSIKVLLARVRNFLRRYRQAEVEIVTFGQFELNRSSQQLSRGCKLIELTPKEYGLLDYILRNKGRALTRDQILNAVWGSDLIVTQRSVDRCVTSLRSKIEESPSRPKLLKTVQKIGYRFEG